MTNNPLPVSGQSAVCYRLSAVHIVCSTINMPRKCVNSSDAFCYICGEVTFKSLRRSFTPLIKKCYEYLLQPLWLDRKHFYECGLPVRLNKIAGSVITINTVEMLKKCNQLNEQ
jgi:hypothetical protein